MNTITSSGIIAYKPNNRDLARQNRKQMTKAEGLFWNVILKQKKTGYKFRRQKPIGPYIVDFYCSKLLLAIEIDGETHELTEERDEVREQLLNNLGIVIVRYNNDQIYSELQFVYKDLINKLKKRDIEMSS